MSSKQRPEIPPDPGFPAINPATLHGSSSAAVPHHRSRPGHLYRGVGAHHAIADDSAPPPPPPASGSATSTSSPAALPPGFRNGTNTPDSARDSNSTATTVVADADAYYGFDSSVPSSSATSFAASSAGSHHHQHQHHRPPAATDDDDEANPSKTNLAHRIVRKRKRNCLSCMRCHRLKVKCDKELPCARCTTSGNDKDCYYSYNKGPNAGKFPCAVPTAPPPESEAHSATWKTTHRVRGSSHWRDLVARIYKISGAPPTLSKALESVATNACLSNFSLPGNFPFGTPGASKYYAREAVIRLIDDERPNCQGYIDRYLAMLDCVTPILDVDAFKDEVERYWKDPHAAGVDWLAQFLMVVGLGCFCSPEEPPLATELMMAAEACLMQTPFMFRPTLVMVKTVCLMVLAKQVCNATCWAVDSCWSLLGILVRLAFISGVPQEKTEDDGELLDPRDREARRKLWVTIVYLDIKVSTGAGMPPLTRPDELGGLRDMPDWAEPDSLQKVLYQSLPTVLTVLSHVNSARDQIAYPDVLRYNAQIRDLMQHAKETCTHHLQRITIDIFLRRCLMVLHRPFALHDDGPTMFPESYWSSLECSLALLMHYRELYCSDPSRRLDLLGRSFVPDFFAASLTSYLHILREDAPLAGAEEAGCEVWPRQIIVNTMRSCVDIWSTEKDRSVCYRTGYNIIEAILDLLPQSGSETAGGGETVGHVPTALGDR